MVELEPTRRLVQGQLPTGFNSAGSRSRTDRLATERPTCGYALQHSAHADVLVNIRPVDALAIADELIVSPLLWLRVGQSPRPRERDANRASIHQVRDPASLRAVRPLPRS